MSRTYCIGKTFSSSAWSCRSILESGAHEIHLVETDPPASGPSGAVDQGERLIHGLYRGTAWAEGSPSSSVRAHVEMQHFTVIRALVDRDY